MKKYNAFVDVSNTWEDGDIEVLTFCVEAKNAEEANDTVCSLILQGEYNEEIGATMYGRFLRMMN